MNNELKNCILFCCKQIKSLLPFLNKGDRADLMEENINRIIEYTNQILDEPEE